MMKKKIKLLAASLAGLAGVLLLGRKKTAPELAEHELVAWQSRELTPLSGEGRDRVTGYWRDAGDSEPDADQPWSAAFIVAMANRADPGSLARAGSHMLYSAAASRGEGAYRVHRPRAMAPIQPGDIILRNRPGGDVTFEDIGAGHFPTHADIVVEVGNGNALAVGGNKLRGMVDYESYPLDDSGTPMSEAVIAVLRKES